MPLGNGIHLKTEIALISWRGGGIRMEICACLLPSAALREVIRNYYNNSNTLVSQKGESMHKMTNQVMVKN